MKKMWSINVFAKDSHGQFTKDLYNATYKWSFDEYNQAKTSFDKIPFSEDKETLCELMKYDFDTNELINLESKFSNHFVSSYIIQGKYQDEIK